MEPAELISGEEPSEKTETEEAPEKGEQAGTRIAPREIETTLNKGMQFLSGLCKMVTGKEMVADQQSISVNKETGEVVMKFRLPLA